MHHSRSYGSGHRLGVQIQFHRGLRGQLTGLVESSVHTPREASHGVVLGVLRLAHHRVIELAGECLSRRSTRAQRRRYWHLHDGRVVRQGGDIVQHPDVFYVRPTEQDVVVHLTLRCYRVLRLPILSAEWSHCNTKLILPYFNKYNTIVQHLQRTQLLFTRVISLSTSSKYNCRSKN